MLSSATPVAMTGPPHFVDLHVNPGEWMGHRVPDSRTLIQKKSQHQLSLFCCQQMIHR